MASSEAGRGALNRRLRDGGDGTDVLPCAAMNERRIVAFGGLREPVRHPLLECVMDLARGPRVGLLAQARGDRPDAYEMMRSRLPARARAEQLDLFDRTVTDVRAWILDKDVIWVSGGNTANMLAVWRQHGVDAALWDAWHAGMVLCGGSAGSLCWFECGTTDSFDLNRLHPLHDGLGLLPGSHCPHYDGEEQRRPLYHSLIADGFPAGIAIDEDAAAIYAGTELREVVSARTGATAYRVERDPDGSVRETPLPARSLG